MRAVAELVHTLPRHSVIANNVQSKGICLFPTSYIRKKKESGIYKRNFKIAYTEEEMSADHDKAYSNYTSPLGAAILMNRLFTDNLVSDQKQSFIRNTLKECKTGTDRIVAPLLDKKGVAIAHKTGSGYVENGVLAAHNDVAYICLPNNIRYTLAVFVKDFEGNESQASQYIAHISEKVYSVLARTLANS